jgi:hypothetical protein
MPEQGDKPQMTGSISCEPVLPYKAAMLTAAAAMNDPCCKAALRASESQQLQDSAAQKLDAMPLLNQCALQLHWLRALSTV